MFHLSDDDVASLAAADALQQAGHAVDRSERDDETAAGLLATPVSIGYRLGSSGGRIGAVCSATA